MRLRTRIRLLTRWTKRFVIYRILHVDDTPHRIALGVAVGMFVAWTPTPGMQMALIVAISALLRANKLVGVPLAWVSNPLTVGVNVLCYWIGCKILGITGNAAKISHAMHQALSLDRSWIERITSFFEALGDAFVPLLVGSLVFATVVAAITYVITYRAVVAFRRHRAARRARSAAPADTPGPQATP